MSRKREAKLASVLLWAETVASHSQGIKETAEACGYTYGESGSNNAFHPLSVKDHLEPQDSDQIEEDVEWFFTHMSTLCNQAATIAWHPGFVKQLAKAHSMRKSNTTAADKAATRAALASGARGAHRYANRCMACGSDEHLCSVAIDFAAGGRCEPVAADVRTCVWLDGGGGVDEHLEAYNVFQRNYREVYGEGFVEAVRTAKRLPTQYSGRWMLGRDCSKRAQLVFQLRSLGLELVYAAEKEVEEVLETGTASEPCPYEPAERLELDRRADAEELARKLAQLERAVADIRAHPPPPLEVDDGFWNIIDACIDAVPSEPRYVQAALRAYAHMEVPGSNRGPDEDDEDDEDDDCDDDDDDDDDDDNDGEDDPLRDRPRQMKRLRKSKSRAPAAAPAAAPARVRARTRVDSDDDDGDDGFDGDDGDDGDADDSGRDEGCEGEAERPRAPTGGPTGGPRTAAGVAGLRRAAGALASNEELAIRLAGVQQTLLRHGELTAAATAAAVQQGFLGLIQDAKRRRE